MLGWPADRMVAPDGSEFFAPLGSIAIGDLRLMVITELAGWTGIRYRWCSPAHMHKLGFCGKFVAAQAVGQSEGLASCCARAAFGPNGAKGHDRSAHLRRLPPSRDDALRIQALGFLTLLVFRTPIAR